ncbi:MAG: putative aminodeoxychorismate lyase [Mucilaginibacter sp.]|uniref:endolytic transglycosylase MltG n=1 Tax=Mucilaginibacter sp. TaxID=1882438 RepID=UPI0026154D67|nr:endolytic transglycosylase MltG [Mucilaginibacter sp.]MDB5002671.1 putative aminodeoxychorismate lyase [Mucilaginibacter sp.]
MAKQTSSGGIFRKFIIALVVLIVLGLGGTLIFYYLRYFGPNVTGNEEYLYIHTGEDFNDVYKTIREKGIVKDTATFSWAAYNMKYAEHVKPGKYRLHEGMSNRKFIRMLQLGEQEQVELSFHVFRTKEQFAGFVSKKLEADSLTLLHYLDSTDFVKQYGFNTDNAFVMIMPDTYQLYWNISPEKFYKRMYSHYETFWTPERKQQAAAINLSEPQVSILASIVDAEAVYDDEMPTIAGLYLNRLRKGMKLESDPTIIFAMHDFTIHRVLNKYLSVNSPYNTYLHTGLPPGPVMLPSVNAVKAVLNYQKNDYLYMVAKEDFSNRHNFATNVAQHNINAQKFRKALDEHNIKK